jgi:pimeloyl-ACP methyl ester carboxylesterase
MILGSRLDGADDAPPVVLSGALGTTTSMWRAQLPALTPSYRVLRHDLPGHGDSPLPAGPVTVAGIGAAVLGLLDDLGVARVCFCGISLGGMVGMWLGAHAPERIERLVLACTGASLGTPETYAERAGSHPRSATRPTRGGSSTSSAAFRARATPRARRPSERSTSTQSSPTSRRRRSWSTARTTP